MRNTELKPDKNGVYFRNLGRKRTRTGKLGQHKFLLGSNRKEAQARNALLERLWQTVVDQRGEEATWSQLTLELGIAIAKGRSEVTIERRTQPSYVPGVERCYESDVTYARRFDQARLQYLFITLVSGSPEAYQRGVEQEAQRITGNIDRLQGKASEFKTTLTDLGQPLPGEMLHDAFQGYIKSIEKDYFIETEGHVNDNGMTKLRQVKTICGHLDNVPISSLDYTGVDALFGYFRKRPKSKRYGTPMTYKSCQNYVGELGRFFRWLHLSPDYPWRRPEDYEFIKRTPDELDEDVEAAAQENPVYSVEQLSILNEYATPIERVFFLLAINCAFGADQSGRLKVRDLRLSEDSHSFIRRIRRKKKVLGTHLLFGQTIKAMRWALDRRKKQDPPLVDSSFLLQTENGSPYWRKTKGGNRCRDIPNLWYDLLDRVIEDHPEFPRLGFNSLRDTSATMIRDIAGEEMSLLHLTHKHQSQDKNLRRYANPSLRRLFRAQRELEKKLAPVLEAAPSPPFAPQPQAYTSRKLIKQAFKLKDEGVSIAAIAKATKLSRSTIYRHLEWRGNQDGSKKSNRDGEV